MQVQIPISLYASLLLHTQSADPAQFPILSSGNADKDFTNAASLLDLPSLASHISKQSVLDASKKLLQQTDPTSTLPTPDPQQCQQTKQQYGLQHTQQQPQPHQPHSSRPNPLAAGFQPSLLPADLSSLTTAASTRAPLGADVTKTKTDFVESLVGTAALIIESIWPSNSLTSPLTPTSKLLPLRRFIQEILRRSRTSFSTLQLALLYIIRLRNNLASLRKRGQPAPAATLCGRRMFLSALLVAAKYLQDRNYSNRAWSKIAGLPLPEINANETEFLACLEWDLYVSQRTYVSWSSMLLNRAGQLKKDEVLTTSATIATTSASASVIPSPRPIARAASSLPPRAAPARRGGVARCASTVRSDAPFPALLLASLPSFAASSAAPDCNFTPPLTTASSTVSSFGGYDDEIENLTGDALAGDGTYPSPVSTASPVEGSSSNGKRKARGEDEECVAKRGKF